MGILDKIIENPLLRSVYNNDKTAFYRTLLIGLGDDGNIIVEQIKNQDTGIKKFCSSNQQSLYEISNMLMDTDLAIIVCGFDTELSMYEIESIALRAKRIGCLTLGIIMTPFESEGKDTIKAVRETIKDIRDVVDSLVVIPKERVRYFPGNESLNADALDHKTEEVLQTICKSILQMISDMEKDNVGLDDIRNTIKNKGIMYFGMGKAEGDDKAERATIQAMNNSLVEGSLYGASSVIINVSGNFSPTDSTDILDIFENEIGQDADYLCNLHVDKAAGDIIYVSVLAAA